MPFTSRILFILAAAVSIHLFLNLKPILLERVAMSLSASFRYLIYVNANAGDMDIQVSVKHLPD